MSQPAVRQPIPVGKYFLDRGRINAAQLDLALKHRAEFGLKLGQSLVELGFVTEADMVEALRHQARFSCVHLTRGIVEARVAAKLGETLSRRFNALALNQIAGHTTVALEDPSDDQALQELAHNLGTRIFPVYAEPSIIRKLLDQTFGTPKGAASPPKRPAPEHPPGLTPASRAAPAAPSKAADEHGAPASPRAVSVSDERGVVDFVRAVLQQAFEQGVGDIHLETRRDELCVRFRKDGALREHSRLPGAWAGRAIACLKALAQLDEEAAGAPQEGSIPFVFKKQSFEVGIATTPSLHGESAVLRVRGQEGSRRELTQLGMNAAQLQELEAFLAARGGLVLVTGPVGCGRRTTLQALLAHLATQDKKVVALVQHVDHEVEGALHVQVDAAAGLSYAAGTRSLMRQDPDVLLVHEAGEPETARNLLEAALSGCSVIAGLRSAGALEALTRMTRLGLEPYLLADALRGVIAQRLVRGICTDCRAPIVPDEVLLERLGLPKDGETYYEGEGCGACHGTGLRGRSVLFEVLRMTPGLRRELEKGAELAALARAAEADGFESLRAHGLGLARAGLTTLHEVLAATAGA